MRFGKVLVGYDGSEHAQRAIRAGMELAGKYEGELLLLAIFNPSSLYAIQAFTPASVLTERMIEQDAQKWQASVEKEAQTLFEGGTTAIRFLREIGHPAQKLLEVAEREKADLIVVGSRGVGGFERLVLGSVSDAIVRHATCPVLIVR